MRPPCQWPCGRTFTQSPVVFLDCMGLSRHRGGPEGRSDGMGGPPWFEFCVSLAFSPNVLNTENRVISLLGVQCVCPARQGLCGLRPALVAVRQAWEAADRGWGKETGTESQNSSDSSETI